MGTASLLLMPRVRLWASTAALAVIVSVPRPADGIRCWGANAIALQREHGEVKSCTHGAEQFDLYRYEGDDVCFDKCGGVTWFEGFSTGGAPFANPDGKRLCPGVVDKGECNCEAWHKTLTPNAKGNRGCPQACCLYNACWLFNQLSHLRTLLHVPAMIMPP